MKPPTGLPTQCFQHQVMRDETGPAQQRRIHCAAYLVTIYICHKSGSTAFKTITRLNPPPYNGRKTTCQPFNNTSIAIFHFNLKYLLRYDQSGTCPPILQVSRPNSSPCNHSRPFTKTTMDNPVPNSNFSLHVSHPRSNPHLVLSTSRIMHNRYTPPLRKLFGRGTNLPDLFERLYVPFHMDNLEPSSLSCNK